MLFSPWAIFFPGGPIVQGPPPLTSVGLGDYQWRIMEILVTSIKVKHNRSLPYSIQKVTKDLVCAMTPKHQTYDLW